MFKIFWGKIMKSRWNYIVAVILMVVCIIITIKPTLLKIILNKINIMSIILIVISMILALLKPILNVIEKMDKKLLLKIVISFICIILVIMRMFNSKLKIDNISIYLIMLSIVIIIIPDLDKFFKNGSKVKIGDIELEFKGLSDEIKEVEQDVSKRENSTNNKVSYDGINKETLDRFELLSSDPKMLIVAIEIEIEIRLRRILNVSDGYISQASTQKKLIYIKEKGILDDRQISTYRKFKSIINTIIHGIDMKDISDEKLYEFADLGMRLLQTIPTNIIK